MRRYCALDLMEGSGFAPAHSRQSKTHENLQSRPRNHPGGGQCRRYPRKGRPGMLARPCLRRHHPTHRTVGDITRGGARGGNPLPGKENHTAPSTGLPRRSGSSRGESPGGAQPGVPVPNIRFAGILPYTGPRGYHPGRGSGREPPPRQREPYWPFPQGSRAAQEREFSWREPGRGATRGASPKHTFRRHLAMHRSPLSPPRTGRVYTPGKAGPGCWPDHASAGIIPYTGPRGYRPGRGSGREPPPRQREPHWPFPKCPAQEREFSWREPGRGATRDASPKHTFRRHLAMHRSPLSPTPHRPRVYPGKAGPGCWPDHASAGIIPHTGPRGYHPGRGSGREPPPRQREPHWPFPQGSRAGAGVLVARARAGRNQGCQSQTYISPASRHASLSSLPHPAPAACIPPERPARDAGPTMPPPASSHTPDRGDIARGGNPLPGKARRSGSSRGESPGGAQPGVPVPNIRFAGISPCTALLSPPPRTGRVYIPGKAGPDHILPQRLVIKVRSGTGDQTSPAPSSP